MTPKDSGDNPLPPQNLNAACQSSLSFPQKFHSLLGCLHVELEQASGDCDELDIHDTMRDRRKRLLELADRILVLPGGLGTLDEFFEALVGRQLAEHGAPIGVFNPDGVMNSLIDMLDDLVEHRFVRESARDLFFVETDPVRAVDRLLASPTGLVDPTRMVPSGPD